jgi:hypothetical protein
VTSFLSDTNTSDSKDPLHQWRYLTLSITANPHNLPLHTQRIMLAMNIHLQPYLAGALQDFFIILKATGHPVKEKMFNLVSPLLEIANRDYFRQWLEEGHDHHLDCIRYAGATLISESCKKITIANDKNQQSEATLLENFLNENYDNTIDKAHYCIAYGDVKNGQKRLEHDILSYDITRPRIEQELLRVYYHTQNKTALETMTQTLLNDKRTLSEDWKKIQSIAKEW